MSKVLSNAISHAIENIPEQTDRDTIIHWFLESRQILGSDKPKKWQAKDLYFHVDSKAVAGGFWNSTVATFSNYKKSKLPFAVKLALPAILATVKAFGGKTIGASALKGATSLPVLFLLFLGVEGVTTIVEPFSKGDKVKDPVTKLLLTLALLESEQKISKELADVMCDRLVAPCKADLSDDAAQMQADLLALSPSEFESHVMALFAAAGHPSGATQASNDWSLDGWAKLPSGMAVVQCKHDTPDNQADSADIEQIKRILEEQKASHGYFITTSSFTEQAKEQAQLNSALTLVDMNTLCEWQKAGKACIA